MTDPIHVLCPKCASSAGDPCRDRYARAKPFCEERLSKAEGFTKAEGGRQKGEGFTKAEGRRRKGEVPEPLSSPPSAFLPPPLKDALLKRDDFDETTPPPRRRPIGTPVGVDVTLGPGEDVVAVFNQWDREGRIPARSLLCERVGTPLDQTSPSSGLKLLAVGAGATVFALPGNRELSLADVEAHRISTWIARAPSATRKWCVLSPMKGR